MINPSLFAKSLKHALRGVWVVFSSEQSFRIQVFVGVCVLLLAYGFQVRFFEWIVLLLLIGSVLCLEIINSIFERIVDTFKQIIHPIVRDIKDIMAAVVFLASLFALFIGLVIFWPHVSVLVLG